MSEIKKIVKKTFWSHQYEKEERFLRKMRSEGWKFVNLHKGYPTKYEFDSCEPEDYIYQLDYVLQTEDTPEYHQLYLNAGWNEEFAWPAPSGKWYYFTKKADGKEERIYTSMESRLGLNTKVCQNFGIIFAIALFLEVNAITFFTSSLYGYSGIAMLWRSIMVGGIVLFGAISLFLVYSIVGLVATRNKIKKQMKDKERLM